MKKLCFIVLCIVLLVPVFGVAVNDVDLSSYTVEQLIEFKDAIIEELLSRDEYSGTEVPVGKYVVGEDIPEGDYTVKGLQYMCIVNINNYDQVYTVSSSDPYIGKIMLKNGDVIEITMGSSLFMKYAGLGF